MTTKLTFSFNCESRLSFSRFIFSILFILFFSAGAFAQGSTCAEIEPFCAGPEGLIFANCNNQDPNCSPSAEPGPDYACLFTQPYPAWFYLQIDQPGNLDFEIIQNTAFDANGDPIGTGLDVDFIAWGPFAIGDDLCDYSQLQAFNEIGCSYSAQPIENFSIPNGLSGERYVLLITNFNQSPGFIKLHQTGGTGTTNCDIIGVCSAEIIGGDQTYCDVDEVELATFTTGPVDSYEWYLDDVLIAGQTSETLTVSETGVYKVIVDGMDCDDPGEGEALITFLELPCNIPICTTIDFEENFGTGTGRVCIDPTIATTTYVCNQTTQVNDGEYTISNTSNGLNTGWHLDMEDHTIGDVDGRMLFVNAAVTAGEFYRRTITLSPNFDFSFNAWITTVYDIDTNICTGTGIPANVIFRIEDTTGVLIAETNTGDIQNEADPNWQLFTIDFNTGSNTDIQLVLINNSIGGCGNDLAIDDITLTKEGELPVAVTPPNLEACDETGNDEATFNLESQISIILDGQDPNDFNFSFHLGQGDAELNLNPILTPNSYVNSSNPQTIFVRMEKTLEPACFAIVSFDLVISDEITLTTNLPSAIDVCSNDNIPQLDATPTNGGIDLTLVTYEWTDAIGTVLSTTATFTPVNGGIYTVVVNYPPCSQNSFDVLVNITEAPTLDLGPDEVLCDGSSFEIVPLIGGNTNGISYLWSTGETSETIIVDETGTYELEITLGPCVVVDSIDIFISEPILVELGNDFKTCPDETNTINAVVQGDGMTYQWFLNNEIIIGESQSSIEVILEAGTFGTQTVSVIVANGDCTGTDSIDLILYDIGKCVISQGLSPNNDNMNDCLDLEFLADRSGAFSLEVFNRYGTSLYTKNNYINEWCGQTNNSDELPTGTYFYVMKFDTPDSEFGAVKTGYIYINRD